MCGFEVAGRGSSKGLFINSVGIYPHAVLLYFKKKPDAVHQHPA